MQKINFYPPLYLLAIAVIIGSGLFFFNILLIYITANVALNSFIIINFLVCIGWILATLWYFQRSYRGIKIFTDSMIGEGTPRPVPLAKTIFDNPIMNQVMVRAEREGMVKVTRTEIDSIINDVTAKAMHLSAWPRFMTGVFVMLGLFGTFLGLLQTIGGVGAAFAALGGDTDITMFVQLLAQPLQGMAVAFSSSLFGLMGSLFTSLGVYIVNEKLGKINDNLGGWLEENISMFIPGIDPDSPINVMAQVFDHVIGRLERTFVESFGEVTDAINHMVGVIDTSGDMQRESYEMISRLVGSQNIDEALRTVATSITNQSNAISSAINEQMQGLSRHLERQAMDQYNSMNDFVKSTSEFLQALRAAVGESFGALNVGLGSMDKTMASLEKSVKTSADTMAKTSAETGSSIKDFTRLMDTSVTGVERLQQATSAVSSGMKEVEGVVTNLSRAVEGVSGAMTSAIDSVTETTRASQGTYRDVAQLFSEGINAMVQSNDTIFQTQREILNASNKAIEVQSGITSGLETVFKSTTTMETMIKTVMDMVAQAQKGVDSTAQLVSSSTAILDKTLAVPEKITESFSTGLTTITKQNTDFLAALKPNFDKFSADAEKILGGANTMQQAISTSADSLKSVVTEMNTAVESISRGNRELTASVGSLVETARATEATNTNIIQALSPLREIQQIMTQLQQGIGQIAAKNIDFAPLERLIAELSRQLVSKMDDIGRIVSAGGFNPEVIVAGMQNMNANLQGVATGIQGIGRPIESLGRLVEGIAQQIANIRQPDIANELNPIQRLLTAIGEELRVQANKNGNVDMTPVINALRPIADKLDNIKATDIAPIIRELQPIREAINKIQPTNLTQVLEVLTPISEKIQTIGGSEAHLENITAGIAIVSNQVKDLITAINKVVETNDTAAVLLPSLEGIQKTSVVMTELLDKMQVGNDNVVQSFLAMQDSLNSIGQSLTEVKEGLGGGNIALTEVKESVNDTLESIRDVITQIAESMATLQNSIKER